MSIAAVFRRLAPGLGVIATLSILGACDQRGFSNRAAELARQHYQNPGNQDHCGARDPESDDDQQTHKDPP